MDFTELSTDLYEDFLQMAKEFDSENDNRYSKHVYDYDSFQNYINHLECLKIESRVPDGYVKSYTYFATKENRIIGAIRYRPNLNDGLLLEGGHIGYDVRPMERNQGYASEMLSKLLKMIRPTHRGKILITCDSDNFASEKIILKNGGSLENETISNRTQKPIKRFWIESEYKKTGDENPSSEISLCRPRNFNADEISQLILDSAIGVKDTDFTKSAWEGFIESYDASTVEKLIKDPKQKFIIAIKTQKIIGIIGIRESQISELFVHPDFQKAGIASKLLIQLLEETDGTLTVNSSINAEIVYSRMGFERLSDLKEKNGILFIPMILKR
jgi:predicted acetyltransferase/ribosomal protein S18 acetylase RimI-like enzyme